MEFFVKDKWIRAKKGDQLTVPIGVKHAFRNPSGKIVRVFNTHQPALKMENYFEDVCKVLDKVTENRTKEFRMNMKSMLYMGVLMEEYREEIIAKNPPDMAIRILGSLGKFMKISY